MIQRINETSVRLTDGWEHVTHQLRLEWSMWSVWETSLSLVTTRFLQNLNVFYWRTSVGRLTKNLSFTWHRMPSTVKTKVNERCKLLPRILSGTFASNQDHHLFMRTLQILLSSSTEIFVKNPNGNIECCIPRTFSFTIVTRHNEMIADSLDITYLSCMCLFLNIQFWVLWWRLQLFHSDTNHTPKLLLYSELFTYCSSCHIPTSPCYIKHYRQFLKAENLDAVCN